MCKLENCYYQFHCRWDIWLSSELSFEFTYTSDLIFPLLLLLRRTRKKMRWKSWFCVFLLFTYVCFVATPLVALMPSSSTCHLPFAICYFALTIDQWPLDRLLQVAFLARLKPLTPRANLLFVAFHLLFELSVENSMSTFHLLNQFTMGKCDYLDNFYHY